MNFSINILYTILALVSIILFNNVPNKPNNQHQHQSVFFAISKITPTLTKMYTFFSLMNMLALVNWINSEAWLNNKYQYLNF